MSGKIYCARSTAPKKCKSIVPKQGDVCPHCLVRPLSQKKVTRQRLTVSSARSTSAQTSRNSTLLRAAVRGMRRRVGVRRGQRSSSSSSSDRGWHSCMTLFRIARNVMAHEITTPLLQPSIPSTYDPLYLRLCRSLPSPSSSFSSTNPQPQKTPSLKQTKP